MSKERKFKGKVKKINIEKLRAFLSKQKKEVQDV